MRITEGNTNTKRVFRIDILCYIKEDIFMFIMSQYQF